MLVAALALARQIPTAPMPATELVANVCTVSPKRPFYVALHMKLPPGWHNYYANPGESGVPTTIKWTLPPGYRAGPILWPVPRRIVIGGIPNYAYEREVWLLTRITPNEVPTHGTKLTIGAHAEWLLCREECIPQSTDLKLTIAVSPHASPSANPGIAAAVRRLPSRHLPFSVSATGADKAVLLGLQLPAAAARQTSFFPADPEAFNADPEAVNVVPGGIQVRVPLNRYASHLPARLTGILVVPGADARSHAYWVDTPVAS